MPTFPAELTYSNQNYGWRTEPVVVRTQYHTQRTRQRFMREKRDYVFTFTITASDAELVSFENFVKNDISNGVDTFDAPYYTSDLQKTGTFELIDGQYSIEMNFKGWWNISYEAELKNRDFTDEKNIYELVSEYDGFDDLYTVANLLAIIVNEDWP